MESTDEDQVKVVVYTGESGQWADLGQLNCVFYEVLNYSEESVYPEEPLKIDEDDPIVFSTKSIKGMVIGGLYKIPVELGEDERFTWSFGKAARVGHWDDKDQIAAWRTADWAQQLTVGKEKTLLKKDKMDYLNECLLPLREEYAKLRGNSRIAFELRVLAAIRRKP